jgi:hypothetical protein
MVVRAGQVFGGNLPLFLRKPCDARCADLQ